MRFSVSLPAARHAMHIEVRTVGEVCIGLPGVAGSQLQMEAQHVADRCQEARRNSPYRRADPLHGD